MNKIILFIILLCFYSKAYAQVTLVEDLANLPHNILSSVEAVEMVSEQIKQYKLIKEEFELLVKNSAAPYFYVYNEVQNFDENVERLKKRFEKFSDPKAVDDYFKKYYDINWYRSSPCFKAGGCTDEDLDRLEQQRIERVTYMTEISSNLKNDLADWKDRHKTRYDRLKKLNNAAQKAEGHFEIQSYQAQYLSEMTQELITLNENMRNFQDYLASLNEDKLAEGLKSIAQSESEWVTPKIKKFQIQKIGD
ncbi:MAG: hypothetical protein K2N11_01905 [Mucispirillum sp.]|nr:hypothetical protein [Mucispirillum sp.]